MAQFNDQPQRRLRRAATFMTTLGASLLLLCFAPPGLGGDAAVMAGCGFLLWMAGVAALLLSFLVQFDEQPQRLLRRAAAFMTTLGASLLLVGFAPPGHGGDAAVMAGCGFLLWMAGVASLLFTFFAQFDEQQDVGNRRRRLRCWAAAAMVLAASVLVHGIPEPGGNANHYGAAVMAGCFFFLWLWVAGAALLLLSLTSVGDRCRHLPKRVLRRCAAVAMLFAASILVYGVPESSGSANHYSAVMAGLSFLVWLAGVAVLLFFLVVAGNVRRHLPPRLLRRGAAVAMLFSASFLVHGITDSGNANHYYAVMAAFSFLLWMALLLFSFLVQFDEQPDVGNPRSRLRGCAAAAMVLAASFLVHGIPDSDGNANQYGAVVMAGCFFLLWMAGVALLLLSLVF